MGWLSFLTLYTTLISKITFNTFKRIQAQTDKSDSFEKGKKITGINRETTTAIYENSRPKEYGRALHDKLQYLLIWGYVPIKFCCAEKIWMAHINLFMTAQKLSQQNQN